MCITFTFMCITGTISLSLNLFNTACKLQPSRQPPERPVQQTEEKEMVAVVFLILKFIASCNLFYWTLSFSSPVPVPFNSPPKKHTDFTEEM